jgi:hypothetical protein
MPPAGFGNERGCILALFEQMSVGIEVRTDVLMPHAALELKGIGAVVDHERSRSMPE